MSPRSTSPLGQWATLPKLRWGIEAADLREQRGTSLPARFTGGARRRSKTVKGAMRNPKIGEGKAGTGCPSTPTIVAAQMWDLGRLKSHLNRRRRKCWNNIGTVAREKWLLIGSDISIRTGGGVIGQLLLKSVEG
ncbi:hypothetical protein Salat_1162600 [Sesamum alatum]|uniref:Uncharacterized protein n=1 Tax=Sesamum alatum TaxID=300844 RepID=A0AAE2CNF3_9LAMI|nr:hypothetical protein Salat_1162600 [Sesamum alatum]